MMKQSVTRAAKCDENRAIEQESSDMPKSGTNEPRMGTGGGD
jgi:hypothetical protein